MIAAASFLSPQRAKEKLETGVDLPVCFHEYMCDQDVGVSPLLISRPSSSLIGGIGARRTENFPHLLRHVRANEKS